MIFIITFICFLCTLVTAIILKILFIYYTYIYIHKITKCYHLFYVCLGRLMYIILLRHGIKHVFFLFIYVALVIYEKKCKPKFNILHSHRIYNSNLTPWNMIFIVRIYDNILKVYSVYYNIDWNRFITI